MDLFMIQSRGAGKGSFSAVLTVSVGGVLSLFCDPSVLETPKLTRDLPDNFF